MPAKEQIADDDLMAEVGHAISRWRALDTARRSVVVQRLFNELLGVEGTGLLQALVPQAAPGMPEETRADVYRALELCAILAGTFSGLDQWTRGVWNRCADDNVQSAPIAGAFAEFVTCADSDPNAATLKLNAQIGNSVDRIQTLIGALGNLPRQYAEKFAPKVVETRFGKPGKSDHHQHCWEGYISLCGGSDVARLAGEIADFWPIVLDRMQKSDDLSKDPDLSKLEVRGQS